MSVCVLVAAAACAAAVAPARAAPKARFGIADDAWLKYGPGTLESRIGLLRRYGVGIVRFTLRWDKIARTRPRNPRDPNDPAYRWGRFATVIDALHAHHIPVLLTLWGTPGWANHDQGPAHLPRGGLGNFAYAASLRFPWVHLWTVWNEPNSRQFSKPVSARLYVRRLLNPTYRLLHKASGFNVVAGGVTSPRRSPVGVSPLLFMKNMYRNHAKLDAYAQNPYPGSPRETPFHDPCGYCHTLTMARLPEIRRLVTRYFGRKPIWLTEYGYQTNPPDWILGVSRRLQAKYVGEAALRAWQQARVTILIHFLIRDEPGLGGWQSGFFTVDGKPKPALRAFGLPLAEISRRGHRVVLWGQVRPGKGRRRYLLQRWDGHRWVRVGRVRRTNKRGAFRRVIRGHAGEKLRIWTPVVPYSSPVLRLT